MQCCQWTSLWLQVTCGIAHWFFAGLIGLALHYILHFIWYCTSSFQQIIVVPCTKSLQIKHATDKQIITNCCPALPTLRQSWTGLGKYWVK